MLKVMKVIQSIYRGYYKTEQEIKDAMNVMVVAFKKWDYRYIERAVLQFIETDTRGFPPVPGQLIAIAKDIRAEELRDQQIRLSKLPEPGGVPMPEELKKRMEGLFTEEK